MKKLLTFFAFIPTLLFAQTPTIDQVAKSGNTSTKIIKYNANHGLQYDDRTLTDKRYVDSINAILRTVSLGGTGVSSFTAYSVIVGGATSTGPIQSVSSVGTSGQFLTSAGAGVKPTWTTPQPLIFSLPLVNTSGTVTITQATTSTDGYLTSTDWNTFNSKQATISVTAPITLSGASVGIVNQGTTSQLLHGNASGNASFGQLVNADITNSTIDLTSKVTGLLPVSNAGTGVGSFTAYSVLCAGTTSTGAFQNVSGLGASGTVLTSNGAGVLPTWQTSSSGWGLTGNSGTTAGTNFIGTTDGQDVVFKRNSSEVMRLYSSSNFVGIGIAAPTSRLHIQGGGSTTSTYGFKYDNSSNTPIIYGRDNGFVGISCSVPSIPAYAGNSMEIASPAGFVITTGRELGLMGGSDFSIHYNSAYNLNIARLTTSGAGEVVTQAIKGNTGHTAIGDGASSWLDPTYYVSILNNDAVVANPFALVNTRSSATGNGLDLTFRSLNDASVVKAQANIQSICTDNAAATFSGDLYLQPIKNNSTVDALVVKSTGAVAFNGASNYGSSGQYLMSNGNAAPTWVSSASNLPHAISTPTTSATVTLNDNQINIISPAGTIAALTVNFPNSPSNNDFVEVTFDQIVTSVTYVSGTGGSTIKGQINGVVGGQKRWDFDNGTNTWY